jgi:hypothetical protein
MHAVKDVATSLDIPTIRDQYHCLARDFRNANVDRSPG